MTMFEACLVADIFILGTVIVSGFMMYFKWKYVYWQRLNVPFLEPKMPFGNVGNIMNRKISVALKMQEIYQEFKSKGITKYGGMFTFTYPRLMILDPELIKNIMAQDFNHWVDRGMYVNEKDDPLSAHLFSLSGQKWRTLRQKLTPTFTSGKMKMMFQTLVDCSDELVVVMDKLTSNKEPVDIKEILGRFTTDIIGSCAFGVECNSLKDPNAEFRKYGRKIFETDKLGLFKRAFMFSNVKMSKFLRLCLTPPDVAKFFMKAVKDTIEYREKNNVTRKDFLQLLLDLKNSDIQNPETQETGPGLTMNELAAQAFVFFAAGFETSSTTMAFALYELAVNQHIQDKVREEIVRVLEKHQGKITYDAINEMTYMEQVVNETLRIYPPVPILQRQCTEEYIVPDTKIRLPVGQSVLLPVYALHHDPEHFPEPEKFDPERFNEENKKSRHPYAFLPFGEGPRVCIGLRFGMMQTKVGLTVLLKNYKFTLSSKTALPVFFDPKSFILTTKGGMWLNSIKI